MTKEELEILNKTQSWIEFFVIEHNICPFAGRSFFKDQIDYRVSDAISSESALYELTQYLKHLVFEIDAVSNAFFILPYIQKDYYDFVDMLEYGYHLINEMGWSETFQLVGFHPDFHYQDEAPDLISNWTNQSPYPMVHILQVEEVQRAIDSVEDVHIVPLRNKKYLEYLDKVTVEAIRTLKNG